MVDMPYSGYASRAAHFARHVSVPGVNADHTTPDPEADPFNPVPDPTPNQAGSVWDSASDQNRATDPGQSGVPNLAQVPVTHWYAGQNPVGSGVPYGSAQQAMQERLMVDHSDANYVPDSIRLYQHWSEGQVNDFVIGRGSQYAGTEIPAGPLAGLGDGTNSYDQTQAPNEVYQGDAANVGRYRLGVNTQVFGLYESPIGKFGQDAVLRAITGLTPALPYDKPPMANTAPYTPNSTGVAHWAPAPAYQSPSSFSLPAETAVTDFSMATAGAYTNTDFEDGGEL